MIRVTVDGQRKGAALWIFCIGLSCSCHVLLVGLSLTGGPRVRTPPPRRVAVVVRKRPRRQPPAPREATKPPAPKAAPETPPSPRRQPPRRRPRRAPSEPPKRVFGVSARSTSSSGGVAVRVGNTLAKEMEPEHTPPAKVTPLVPRWAAAPAPAAKPPKPKKLRPRPVPVYELTRAPSFKRKVAPRYPARAKQRGIRGTVLLEALIDARGRVLEVRVVRSPHPLLASAAKDALRRSTLAPGLLGKRAVAVRLRIPYRFVLDG